MRSIFTAIVLLIVVGAVALWMGWITLGTTDQGDTEIIIHKQKIKEDVGTAVERGKHALDRENPESAPEPTAEPSY